MKFAVVLSSIVALAAAAADPQVTARAELLGPRQNSDPALLGYLSSGSSFSAARSCDFPATLSREGSYAQCCSGNSCVFWTSCSAGTLFASQTSLRCDQGFCNTAVIQASVGASTANSYLGCWATSLGEQPFTLVANIGSASVAQGTPSASGSASSGGSARPTSGASSSSTPSVTGSTTQSATEAAQTTGAAVRAAGRPLTGVVGVVAMMFGLL